MLGQLKKGSFFTLKEQNIAARHGLIKVNRFLIRTPSSPTKYVGHAATRPTILVLW